MTKQTTIVVIGSLRVNIHGKISADNILKYLSSCFIPGNMLWHFMQIVSQEDNLHEKSKRIFLEKFLYAEFAYRAFRLL